MGFHPRNLQSTLPTVQWICGALCQNSQVYTAVSQIQWYKCEDWTYSTSRPPQLMPNYPHPLRCTTARYVPPTILNSQYWPSSLASSRASWGLSWVCKVLCWQALKAACTILWWSANCCFWHPKDTHYSSLCPFKEQLPSAYCKWKHLLPYQMPPPGMQHQMQWCWAQDPISHIRTGLHQVSQTYASACYNHSMNTAVSYTCDLRIKSCCSSFYTCNPAKGSPQCLHDALQWM